MSEVEVAIIGAGPAGLTAAIQLQRYGIPFILLEKARVGGLLWNANLVENYPGFPAGISGPKLIRLMEKQAFRIGVKVTSECVTRVDKNPRQSGFLVTTHQRTYEASRLIIASGTRAMPAPYAIPVTCASQVYMEVWQLAEEKGKRIVIVGAGDAAFDYALNMAKNRNSVTILNRSGEVKCLELLFERATADPAISYRASCPVRDIESDEKKGSLLIRCETGETIEADFLVFAIGRIPQVDFLPPELLTWDAPGLNFIGDVKNGSFRQAAIAAGDGLRAAMEIYFNLEA